MAEITFEIKFIGEDAKELVEYLCTVDGVLEAHATPLGQVYIKYNKKLISIKRLVE